jgi:flagellin
MGRINSNIQSLQAIGKFNKNNADLNLRLERLSSGLKINRGKDAPAALIASETLRSEIQGIRQAVDNTTRANNVINTAEGALGEVSTLLLELQSLTLEAANRGALSTQEIEANQLQVDTILNSINRISNTTQFNGIKLLNGALDYTTSGVNSAQIDIVSINAAKIPDNGFNTITVEVLASAMYGELTYTGGVPSDPVTIEIAGNKGVEQVSIGSGTSLASITTAINQIKDATGVSAIVSGSAIRLNSTTLGSDQFVSIKTLAGTFTDGKDFGADATVAINGTSSDVKGNVASLRTGDLDVTLTLDAAFAQQTTTGGSFTITGGGAKFQIGSQVNRQGQIQVGIGSVATTKLGNDVIGFMSTLASGGANSLVSGNNLNAQTIISEAIRQTAVIRGRLGALQKNVLDTNSNSLSVALENVTASESAIRDADFAAETAALTRSQILVQANTSVLAQANSQPQNVLALLGR